MSKALAFASFPLSMERYLFWVFLGSRGEGEESLHHRFFNGQLYIRAGSTFTFSGKVCTLVHNF